MELLIVDPYLIHRLSGIRVPAFCSWIYLITLILNLDIYLHTFVLNELQMSAGG